MHAIHSIRLGQLGQYSQHVHDDIEPSLQVNQTDLLEELSLPAALELDHDFDSAKPWAVAFCHGGDMDIAARWTLQPVGSTERAEVASVALGRKSNARPSMVYLHDKTAGSNSSQSPIICVGTLLFSIRAI